MLDASSLLLLHAFAGLGRVRKRRSPQRRFGRHGPPSLFTAILVDKISLITVFEGSWSPSSRFGSNPAFHSLHAETFQEAGCLCWMHQNLLSSCSTPLQVPAVCVNAGLLNDALGDKGFLPSLFMGKISVTTISESSWSSSSRFGSNPAVHSLHAETFQEPCCLCWMRLLSSCSMPLQVSALQSPHTPMGKISVTTISDSSWSSSSCFGSNPAVHSLHVEKFREACCLCWMRLLSSCSTPLQVSAVCVNATLLNDALGDMGSLHSSKPSHPYGQDLSHNYF